jgi:hypothetical protein
MAEVFTIMTPGQPYSSQSQAFCACGGSGKVPLQASREAGNVNRAILGSIFCKILLLLKDGKCDWDIRGFLFVSRWGLAILLGLISNSWVQEILQTQFH